MTKWAWVRGLPRRRSATLAVCALAALLLLGLLLRNETDRGSRTAALERENTRLQLVLLGHALKLQSEELTERARELAESDAVLRLMLDSGDNPADRVELAEVSHRGVDSLLLLSAARSARLSMLAANGGLREQPPDPAMMHFAESAADKVAPLSAFEDDRWLAARPIMARATPSATLGWVVVSRSLSPALIRELAAAAGGSLAVTPLEQFDASVRRPGEPLGITTQLSPADDTSGFAVLHDVAGNAVRALRLSRGQSLPGSLSSSQDSQPGRGDGRWYVLTACLALAGIVAAVTFMLKRYFRHQRSVDARYKALIDQANDGIVIVDASTHKVLYTNPAFVNRLGYTNEEAQALTLTDIFADAGATPESILARLRDADSLMALNLQQRCKNGSFFDTEVRCNALDVDGRDVLAYVTHDVSLRRKAEQQLIENQQRLDRMAHHDQLTGLPNRHYLTAFLPQAIAEAKLASTMLGVVFLDLDRFKHINDTRGHETGDKLLQEVATRLRACVRDSDVVIRMGGDEFVVVFRNVKSYDEVTLGAGRIIETLNRPIVIDQHSLQTTGSVGVSLYPRDGADMVELLKHSDTAMYQAKDRGRNNVQMFSHAMNRKLKHRVAVEASLREALRLKQLDVHFQPFVNLLTRKIVGLEALMRWSHPVHGMIPADQFIPVAEETGLIVPMGNFVLHRTLQTMSAWRKAGVPLVPVSLNVAPAQLQRGELQSTISTLLKSHNLRPEMLQLEMTERAMFDSRAAAGENRQDTIARLRELGIKIAIDDFGTGYSSLSYLKNWRVDALKIDRSFVRDLVTDSSDLAIVSAIIAIARHLHIQVIAEGIEAYQQAEILRRLGCSVGQGYLFARPMPADQCLQFLRDNAEPAKDEEEDMLAVFSAGRG
jgi:diguanylate cyclase (GGDEF)-like protein/PAS domain S-box-containing protein